MADRLGPVRRGRGAPALGRGARAPVPRGGSAVPRGGPRPADRADPRPPARDGAAGRRRRAGTTTRRPPVSDPAEVAWAVDVYSRGVRGRAAAGARRPRRCSTAWRRATAWRSSRTGRSPRPSTATWRRPAGRRTWRRSSSRQRVGTIKPHPAIFAAAREALGSPPPGAILHVGDDWAADVVGAKRAGLARRVPGVPARRLAAPRQRAGRAPWPRTWSSRRWRISSRRSPRWRPAAAQPREPRPRRAPSVDSGRWRPGTASRTWRCSPPRSSPGSSSGVLVTTRDPYRGRDGRLPRRAADRPRGRHHRHAPRCGCSSSAATAASPTRATGSAPPVAAPGSACSWRSS